MEEAGLHHGVDAVAHADFFRHGEGVDHPQVDGLVDHLLLDVLGQLIPDLFGPVRRVEQERRPVLGELDDLGSLEQAELVAGDEVGAVDQVGGPNRLGTEAKVRDGDRTGLLGVVDEVSLGEQVRAFADDLDRGLVGAHGAVRAEPEEHGLDFAGGPGVVEFRVDRQAQVGDVVVDADREVLLGLGCGELVEDRLDHRGRHFLRRKPVSPADDPRHGREGRLVAVHSLGDGGHDLQIERLADGARLLGPIENGDGSNRGRQGRDELLRRERLEEPHLHQPDLLAGGDERVDGLLDSADRRAHDDDDALRVGGALVVDQPVLATRPRGELGHHFFDDAGQGQVVRVGCFASLEEDVRVLGGSSDHRGVRREAAAAEGEDVLVADEGPHVVVLEKGDLVDLVGGPESVEEVEERDPGPERGGVGDQGEVVRFLNGAGGQHRPTRGPGVHDVAVIAEDRKGVSRERARRYVNDRRASARRRS